MGAIVGGAIVGVCITGLLLFIPIIQFFAPLIGGSVAARIAGQGAGIGALTGFIMAIFAAIPFWLLASAGDGWISSLITSFGYAIFIIIGFLGALGGAIGGASSRPTEIVIKKEKKKKKK